MISTLKELYIHQVKDLYNAETQVIQLFPTMAQRAQNGELQEAFTDHVATAGKHRDAVAEIARTHGAAPTGETCQAMEGIVNETKHLLTEISGDATDAGLIAAAQRLEHYGITGYGTLAAFAKCLGYDEDASTFSALADCEGKFDSLLTKLATGGLFGSGINEAAAV